MDAIILAAGKGTRVYPFTQTTPKPLIRIANKAVLEHNLDQMVGIITHAIIIVGYKKDMIIDHLGHTYKGIKLTYLIQEEQKGTGHALLQARNLIAGKMLVLNGDDLFARKDMLNLLQYPNCILVEYKDDPSAFGSVVIENNKVKEIVEKSPIIISNYVNTGMYCFEQSVFDILPKLKPSIRGEYELTDAVKILSEEHKMYAQAVEGYWIPVGYPWHILDATEMLLTSSHTLSIKGTVSAHVRISGTFEMGEGSVIEEHGILTGNSIIGKNVKIGKNILLTGYCAIADNTVIEDNVVIHNSIIGENCHLRENSEIYDSVLGNNVVIHPQVVLHNTNPRLITSQKTISIHMNGKTFDSAKRELGSFIADNINVQKSLPPGEIVGYIENGNNGNH